MIRYALKCAEAHEFESWFQSAAAYEALRGAGHVNCPVCGDSSVEKLLMAPAVRPARRPATAPHPAGAPPPDGAANPSLALPQNAFEEAMTKLRAEVEAKSDYVGERFVAEARKMHSGEAPERSIYGEARPEEARKLVEEGIPIAPLPFLPRRKAN